MGFWSDLAGLGVDVGGFWDLDEPFGGVGRLV